MVASVQVHPVPLIAVAVSPVGSVSTTLTAPEVDPAPEFVTVMVYVAPTCPCVKLPVCDFDTVKSDNCTIVVGSVAVSFDVFVSPPPDTVTEFVTLAGAFDATFTGPVRE